MTKAASIKAEKPVKTTAKASKSKAKSATAAKPLNEQPRLLKHLYRTGDSIRLDLGDGQKNYMVVERREEGLIVHTPNGLVEIKNTDSRIAVKEQ